MKPDQIDTGRGCRRSFTIVVVPMVLPPARAVHEKAHVAMPQWCDSLTRCLDFTRSGSSKQRNRSFPLQTISKSISCSSVGGADGRMFLSRNGARHRQMIASTAPNRISLTIITFDIQLSAEQHDLPSAAGVLASFLLRERTICLWRSDRRSNRRCHGFQHGFCNGSAFRPPP